MKTYDEVRETLSNLAIRADQENGDLPEGDWQSPRDAQRLTGVLLALTEEHRPSADGAHCSRCRDRRGALVNWPCRTFEVLSRTLDEG